MYIGNYKYIYIRSYIAAILHIATYIAIQGLTWRRSLSLYLNEKLVNI